jgi:hypothetical protein
VFNSQYVTRFITGGLSVQVGGIAAFHPSNRFGREGSSEGCLASRPNAVHLSRLGDARIGQEKDH